MKKTYTYGIKILVLLAILGSGMVVSMASATIFTKDGVELNESQLYELTNGTPVSGDEKSVLFFFDPDCESCIKVEEFIEPYLVEHPDTKMVKVNVANGKDEMDRFESQKKDFNREKVFVPVMYFGSVALEGSTDIVNNFESVYAWYIKK